MQRKAWIQAEWAQTENNRRAKYYELTKTGRKRLRVQVGDWERLCAAIATVMRVES
jgi:DNA-binding PadR family transcriptional regulator